MADYFLLLSIARMQSIEILQWATLTIRSTALHLCTTNTRILINFILRDVCKTLCCVDNYICHIIENIPEGIELPF